MEQVIRTRMSAYGLLRPLDVLLVGGTGTGKSSTINAVFGGSVARVGDGVDPETQIITGYKLHEYLRFHDSAGLGDGKVADAAHAKNIMEMLYRRLTGEHNKYALIDLALVILDGGSRDLGTAFRLLETVVLKSIEPERVIVAINQADMAMKGRHWNGIVRKPDLELQQFLDEKVLSVQRRVKEATGLSIRRPVYYSALHGYNVDALMEHIVDHIPVSRREFVLH